MKIINFKNTILALYLILAFFLLLKNSYSYLDPDLGWHLKIGEEIVKTKKLPNVENHDFTLSGKEWVDHEWLINAITFSLYSRLGYGTVSIFFALLIILSLVLLYFLIKEEILEKYKKRGLSLSAAKFLITLIPLQLFGLIASFPSWGVRMQEISALGLVLTLLIISYYTRRRAQKQKTNILFWLPPLFYLWACLHAGFLIGLFIIFFWPAIKITENLLFRINFFHKTLKLNFKNKLSAKDIAKFLFFSAITLILTLLTPYGLKLYGFLKSYGNTFYLTSINEWLPFYYYPIQYKQIVYIAIVSAFLLLIIIFALRKKGGEGIKLDLWDFSLAVFFIFLALKSRRHFPLLFIVSLPLLVKFIFDYFILPAEIAAKKSFSLSGRYLFFIKFYLSAALIFNIFLIGLSLRPAADPFSFFCQQYPCAATDFLKNKGESGGNFFAEYSWGGYLIWKWPGKKLFIDGRLPQYPFAGRTLLEEYIEFFKENKAEEKLKEYDIKLVLLKDDQKKIKLNWLNKKFFKFNEENMNKNENHLRDYLDNSKNWQLSYRDGVSRVYEKIIK
jgi:hypothetical protein